MSKPKKQNFDYILFLKKLSNKNKHKSSNNITYINNNYNDKKTLSYFNNDNNNNNNNIQYPILYKSKSTKCYNISNKLTNSKIKEALYQRNNNSKYHINKNNNNKNERIMNKTFYSIKRKMNVIFPRSNSSINIKNNNFKNVFHSDSFQKIKNNIYNNALNSEYNNKKKEYELLLYSLIKKDKNPNKNELNIKYKFIKIINEKFKKNYEIDLKSSNKEILSKFKKTNYKEFQKDIFSSIKRTKEMENKIKVILDSADSKFDKIFTNIMGKKCDLSS